MPRSISNNGPARGRAPRGAESGFTLTEMVVAMVILMVGLLSLAQVFGYALSVSNRGRGITNAKLLVVTVLEQMENLRNTGQLTYGQIANAGKVSNEGGAFNFGGFTTGFHPVPKPEAGPGTDGMYGTADDPSLPSQVYDGFERKIEITSLGDDNIKRVVVTLRYRDGGGTQQELTGTGYLNNDFRSNILR